jgi:hypothetical protein
MREVFKEIFGEFISDPKMMAFMVAVAIIVVIFLVGGVTYL